MYNIPWKANSLTTFKMLVITNVIYTSPHSFIHAKDWGNWAALKYVGFNAIQLSPLSAFKLYDKNNNYLSRRVLWVVPMRVLYCGPYESQVDPV
jgi:hypothetical protein